MPNVSVMLMCSSTVLKTEQRMFKSVTILFLVLVWFNSIVMHLSFKKLPSKNTYFTVFFFFSFEGWFESTESK